MGAAGRKYGHTCFIHAIIDGKVYFSDSQTVKIGQKEYPEGTPVSCTIEEFGRFYEPWTFEGTIHFTYPKNHTCDRERSLFTREDHPHYRCNQCSVCGGAWMDETPGYRGDCFECNYPGTPVLEGMKSCYLAGTEIQFFWEDTERTVGYELILERQGPDGAYAVMDTVSTAISGIALSPEPGSYRAAVRSIHERGACCTSEPVYFRVVEQWDCVLYGHELTEAATIAASCEEDGTITYTCAHCQDAPVLTLPALGHSFGGGEVEQVPTEESEGQRVYTCATCGLQRYQTLPALSRNPFGDIRGDAYYYWPVIWAHEAGITMGMCEDEFEPYGSATRAQVVTFLWRMAGCPEPDVSDCPFEDVDLESYYAQALLWALESGIARGMSDTKFAPGDPVTRGQFVTFLHRLAGAPEVACGTTFADTGFGAYYDAAVLWATRTGVTTGMGNGTFAPTAACTRGQIVTFLNRYAQPAD